VPKDTVRKAVRQANLSKKAADSRTVGPADPDRDLEAHLRLALATWPQIDPEVERIVSRIARAGRHFEHAAQHSLSRVGLTKEEYKVLCVLGAGERSHGSLCNELTVSTGAMTNRLDKLERAGLLARFRDARDRRGVMLALTPLGRQKLTEYVDTGSKRERELLASLSTAEKQQLNRLLSKLLKSLQADLG
jgi:DNA-binding MarR family transcriptional regulator